MIEFLGLLVIVILVAGVIVWGIGQLTFVAEPFRKIAQVLIICVVAIWVLIEIYQRFIK